MRFTPTGDCQVLKAKVYSYVLTGSGTCDLYIYNDVAGKPGTLQFSTTYVPSANAWDDIVITSEVNFDADFWIVIKIPTTTTLLRIYAISDNGENYTTRGTTRRTSTTDWEVPGKLSGDLCIRAVVSYTGIEEEELLYPYEKVVLEQNYPNPFVNETDISYTLPRKANVELKIYDVAGKLVRTLVNDIQSSGQKRVAWDRKDEKGKAVHSGVYFYGLKTGVGASITKVMVVF